MIWSYRAINNPVARRKWLYLSFALICVGLIYSTYKVLSGESLIGVSLVFVFFALMVFLYTIITLGKIRYYIIEGDTIIYKPFKTKIEDIVDFHVDEGKKVIKLKLRSRSLFKVRTLYFERDEDLNDVLKFLRKTFQRSP